jgi:hypothetical protein
MAIAGLRAQVRVSGPPVAFSSEATTADAGRIRYRIDDVGKGVWGRTAPVEVRRSTDGASTLDPVAGAEYALDRLAGTVVFHTPQASGTVVQVSGEYLPLSVAAEAREFSYTLSGNSQEASRFGDAYTRRAQGLRDVTGSLSQWTTAERYFEDALTAGEPLVLEFYSQADGAPDLRVWAMVSSTDMKAAVDGLMETTVEWEGTPDADGRAVSLG